MKKSHPEKAFEDDEEIAARRDAALLRALSTPHKRHSEMKIGKSKPESRSRANPKKRGRPPRAPESNGVEAVTAI
jgi:hypothetical protein